VSAAVPQAGAPAPARGAGSPPTATLARLPPAWTIAAALAVVYMILAPTSPDLAAATYRSSLFSSAGFTLWDNSWYGGHHLLAYSVIAPALGALIGPRLLAALSMVLATALFASLIDGWFPTRATRIAAAWFALGASVALLSSRVPFDLGLAIGLGAVLAARRRRLAIALALSVLTALASPVAGAFLALAFLAWALVGPARAWPAALTFGALAPIALLALVFPEGGSQPFVGSAFYPEFVGVLVILALIEREHRMLRIGVALYALALAGSFALSTAVGGNADRLGALAAGPVAALALVYASRWRRRALLVLAPLLLYWQVNAPVADYVSTLSNPSVEASFYTPLIGELRALGVGYGARPARIEVVATADHWEARFLAPHVMIARGWERQLDIYRNGLFYEESTPLTAARYRAWLSQNAISYVALPEDAPLDYSSGSEARLLTALRPPYLREVWHSAHWRLFAVLGATPLAQPPTVLTGASSDSLSLYAPRPGSYLVRVHFTPYWALGSGNGCVSRAPGDWTEVQARRAGELHVIIRFSLARVFDRGQRCS
jgi:MFS family permease